MENKHEEQINRNEKRINDHSNRIKRLENTQISIIKDNTNFDKLIDKLTTSIDALTTTVIRMESSPDYFALQLKQLTDKVDKVEQSVSNLKDEDGDKWKHYSKLVVGGLITAGMGYILGGGM